MLEAVWPAVVYGITGIFLSLAGYRLFDLLETRIDFSAELKSGNMAVAIVIGCFILGMCFIIGRAVGG
ncbi:MAG: DUF350 domain-containing protein [Planctomycetaceae bacterium]|jgi:uncharacterized membrane protein YjfL (UPF0719 family)